MVSAPNESVQNNYTTFQFILIVTCIVFVALATAEYIHAVHIGLAKPLPVTWIAFAVPTFGSAYIHWRYREYRKPNLRRRDAVAENVLNWADILSIAFILLHIVYVWWGDASRVIIRSHWIEDIILVTTIGCMLRWYFTRDHEDTHLSLQIAKAMGYLPVLFVLASGSQTEPFWGWFLYWIAAVAGFWLTLLRSNNNGNGNRLVFWYNLRPILFCGAIWILIFKNNNWSIPSWSI